MINILFICHGNICRSPMAEFVMKDLVKKAGREKEFHIESAATSSEEIGNAVHPGTKRKLHEHGISCAGKIARRIRVKDYDDFNYLICMDEYNVKNTRRFFGGDDEGKISLLLDGRPIADPWYTGNFEDTWDDVLSGCTALLERL